MILSRVEQPGCGPTGARSGGQPSPPGLREYALLLWRKRVTILVVAAICVGATLAYCVLTKPTYQASASVLLEPPISQTLVEANSPAGIAPLAQRARRH